MKISLSFWWWSVYRHGGRLYGLRIYWVRIRYCNGDAL